MMLRRSGKPKRRKNRRIDPAETREKRRFRFAVRRPRPPAKNRRVVPQEPPLGDGDPPQGEGDARRGWLRSAASWAGAAALVVLVAASGYLLYRYATTSSYFALRYFEVSGNRQLTNRDVMEAAGLALGTNVFSIDVAAVEARVEKNPWVLDAAVAIQLPGTVRIDVTERTAVATLMVGVPYLVDETGELFKRRVPKDPLPAPMITGIDRVDIAQDIDRVQHTVRTVLAFAQRYAKHRVSKAAVLHEVHVEEDEALTIVVGDGVVVRLGRPPYRTKLARLDALLARLRKLGRQAAIIYLDNARRPDRVTVRLKPAGDSR